MILAHVKFKNTEVIVTEQEKLVSGNFGNTITVEFEDGWPGDLVRHVVLRASDAMQDTIVHGGTVEVDDSVMCAGGRWLTIAAYSNNPNGDVSIRTADTEIGYIYHGTREIKKCEPYPGWSDRIEQDVDNAVDVANSVRRDADNGLFDGTDGVSPDAKVEQETDGATVTITDFQGTTTAKLLNGKDGKDGKDGITQDISGKQNWATVKLAAFPEAETEDSLHAWVNANHKGPDRKWLIESSNPDWAKLVASLGGVPDGVSPDDSAFIILEIPYSEAGPELLEAKYIMRNSMNIWNQTQHATYSTPTPTWHKSGWYRLDDSANILKEAKEYADGKVVTIEIEDRGGQNFWTRPVTTAREIIDMVNAGKEVRLSFYDTLTNTGDQIYQYENTRVGVPYFRRNIITADKVSRISWGVQYNGSIVAEEIPYDPSSGASFTVSFSGPAEALTADKTFSETLAAINKGMYVSGHYDGDIFLPVDASDASIRFSRFSMYPYEKKVKEARIKFSADESAFYEFYLQDPIPTSTSDLTNDSGFTTKALGLTATAPGDLIKVKSVDASGVPTAWEKTSLDELEGKWEVVEQITTETEAEFWRKGLNYKAIYARFYIPEPIPESGFGFTVLADGKWLNFVSTVKTPVVIISSVIENGSVCNRNRYMANAYTLSPIEGGAVDIEEENINIKKITDLKSTKPLPAGTQILIKAVKKQ